MSYNNFNDNNKKDYELSDYIENLGKIQNFAAMFFIADLFAGAATGKSIVDRLKEFFNR